MKESAESSGDGGVIVLARPPIAYLISILAGIVLNALWPMRIFPLAVEPFGLLLILVALAALALSVREFRSAGTPIRTRRVVTALVTTGPYRLSRNPIYLSFTLVQLGASIWLNSAWILGLLVPTVAFINYGVIAREEQYMGEKFGDQYARYTDSVRRWI